MAVEANVAPNINETQTSDFYFTVVFTTTGTIDANGFTLANIGISGSTDVSASDLFLLQVIEGFALIAVNLPRLVTGSFDVDLIGSVTIDGVSDRINSATKTIQYDTTGVVDPTTYVTTPPTSATTVDVDLSAASIENSGTIIVRFEFDFPYLVFPDSDVTVSPAGASKTNAQAIDRDDAGKLLNRLWIMTVTVPSTGSGTVTLTVDSDAFSFLAEDLTFDIGYSGSIALVINTDDLDIAPIEGTLLNHGIRITGNAVDLVDVQGLLRPFYHHWDSTMGILYIRSLENLTISYSNFRFVVTARDAGTSRTTGVGYMNSPLPTAPSIIPLTDPINLIFEIEVSAEIEIQGKVDEVTVEGTWLGLDHRQLAQGVEIFGTLLPRGSGPGNMIPGVNSGNFLVKASNAGGDALPVEVPWVLNHGTVPQFEQGGLPGSVQTGTSLTTEIVVTGVPRSTITLESGSLPTGLSLATSYTTGRTVITFPGTISTSGTSSFAFKLKALNTAGMVISGEYSITVYDQFVAPSYVAPDDPPTLIFNDVSEVINLVNPDAMVFDRGSPPGVFTLSGQDASFFNLTEDGLLSLTPAGVAIAATDDQHLITLACTNQEGTISLQFRIFLF